MSGDVSGTAFCVAMTSSGLGQTVTGLIRGTVQDPNGAVLEYGVEGARIFGRRS